MPEWFIVQITENVPFLAQDLPGGDGFPVLVAAAAIRLEEARPEYVSHRFPLASEHTTSTHAARTSRRSTAFGSEG